MKKTLLFFLIFNSLVIIAAPAVGAAVKPPATTIDRRLNDLSNRFNALEATWGRFQLGGNVSVEADSQFADQPQQLPAVGFKQELNLFMNSTIDQNLAFSVKLNHQGQWGYLGSLTTAMQVDEAFLKMEYPHTLNYLGRFRFSLGPLGLISDFFNNPAEGFAVQRAFKDFHAIGLYSRIYTTIDDTTGQIKATEDYFAGRFGWSDQSTVIGFNFVPNGLATEQAFSFDYAKNLPFGKLAAEIGWFWFRSEQYPEDNADWAPGMMISYSREIQKKHFFQVKAAYLSSQFRPSSSSLNHATDDNREWFIPNSYGLEFYLQDPLNKGLYLDNRLLVSTPVQDYLNTGTIYRLRSSLLKNLSPVSQLQFGLETKQSEKPSENLIFASWNLQF